MEEKLNKKPYNKSDRAKGKTKSKNASNSDGVRLPYSKYPKTKHSNMSGKEEILDAYKDYGHSPNWMLWDHGESIRRPLVGHGTMDKKYSNFDSGLTSIITGTLSSATNLLQSDDCSIFDTACKERRQQELDLREQELQIAQAALTDQPSSGLGAGAIIGIIFGVLLIIGLIIFLIMKSKK